MHVCQPNPLAISRFAERFDSCSLSFQVRCPHCHQVVKVAESEKLMPPPTNPSASSSSSSGASSSSSSQPQHGQQQLKKRFLPPGPISTDRHSMMSVSGGPLSANGGLNPAPPHSAQSPLAATTPGPNSAGVYPPNSTANGSSTATGNNGVAVIVAAAAAIAAGQSSSSSSSSADGASGSTVSMYGPSTGRLSAGDMPDYDTAGVGVGGGSGCAAGGDADDDDDEEAVLDDEGPMSAEQLGEDDADSSVITAAGNALLTNCIIQF